MGHRVLEQVRVDTEDQGLIVDVERRIEIENVFAQSTGCKLALHHAVALLAYVAGVGCYLLIT